jgi:dihydroxyacid dehydratase/phosphogluconate dehydratase
MDAVRANRRPSQLITRTSIENAIASVAASGGSTNAVLHLIAIAREMNIPLTIDDFDIISKRTPYICDMVPAGKYMASDFQAAGGTRLLAKRLIDAGYADGSTLSISGKTLAEDQARRRSGDPEGQPGAGGLRDEDRGRQPLRAPWPGARLRLRRRLLRRRAVRTHQAQRCSGHPL